MCRPVSAQRPATGETRDHTDQEEGLRTINVGTDLMPSAFPTGAFFLEASNDRNDTPWAAMLSLHSINVGFINLHGPHHCV